VTWRYKDYFGIKQLFATFCDLSTKTK